MLRKGFTLIELLIVISILGILAVAVLSAINPVEQLKKARDARRKSDVAELLNAHERYFTTFGCYVWDNYTGTCANGTNPSAAAVTAATFAAGSGNVNGDLMTKEELKAQFSARQSVTMSEMFMTEAANNQVSICFSPESKSARAGGLGSLRTQTNAATGSCGAAYAISDATCNVCVPQ